MFAKTYSNSQNIKVYEEHTTKGNSIVYADNFEKVPYTIHIALNLTNAKSSEGNNFKLIIAPNTQKMYITSITAGKGKYSVGLNYEFEEGNSLTAFHNAKHVYKLPYLPEKQFKVSQGYHGHHTHKNKKAIDFEMPIGTKICATRSGTVIKVKEDSNSGCNSSKCLSLANYIDILHEDGSVANYSHLKYNGVLVKEGDKVTAGDVIALSGNTGYSNKPHLHFEVYVKQGKKFQTVETLFDINGKAIAIGNTKHK
jgi:murein DD-endopeptidase MepM/ murein hydrolase activator NlpD